MFGCQVRTALVEAVHARAEHPREQDDALKRRGRGRAPGSAGDAHGAKAEVPEDQRIVGEAVEDVADECRPEADGGAVQAVEKIGQRDSRERRRQTQQADLHVRHFHRLHRRCVTHPSKEAGHDEPRGQHDHAHHDAQVQALPGVGAAISMSPAPQRLRNECVDDRQRAHAEAQHAEQQNARRHDRGLRLRAELRDHDEIDKAHHRARDHRGDDRPSQEQQLHRHAPTRGHGMAPERQIVDGIVRGHSGTQGGGDARQAAMRSSRIPHPSVAFGVGWLGLRPKAVPRF